MALLAAACGGDNDGGDAQPTQSSEAGTNADTGDNDGGDAQPTQSSEAAESTKTAQPNKATVGGSGSELGSGPVELTASFRGVTEDTIHVGFTAIDFDRLNSEFRLELPFASAIAPMEALVADLNARGGIHGRHIQLHVHPYLPVGATEAEAACVELTEDVGVFAVLGGFNGPGTETANDCIVDLHDTILIGASFTAEQQARSTAPWVNNGMVRERRARALVSLLADEGRLSELGSIAILASSGGDDPVIDALRSAFADHGSEVLLDATITTTGDIVATRAMTDVIVERARSEGAETFVFLGDDGNANEQLVLYADEFNLVWLNTSNISGWSADPPPGLTDAKLILGSGVGPINLDDYEPCRSIAETVFGAEIRTPGELDEGDINYYYAMTDTCNQLRLFEALALAAGPDLTNESFVAAIDRFGEYSLPGTPFLSLGPGKRDANDTLWLTVWDGDAQDFVPVVGPFNATD